MARRGENIRKRKDGRWEGRYIKARTSEGKVQWGYVYVMLIDNAVSVFYKAHSLFRRGYYARPEQRL